MNSSESELKHFWIRVDQRWMSLKRKPGTVMKRMSESENARKSFNWNQSQSFAVFGNIFWAVIRTCFRCKKCLPLVSLDTLSTDFKTTLVLIPEIDDIRPNQPSQFGHDHKYLGKIVEFYHNYMSRMINLKGVAINGWSSNHAKSIFEAVENTFEEMENPPKDFEIDWIIFNGSCLTVVEAGMRGETTEKAGCTKFGRKHSSKNWKEDDLKGMERLISKKLDQIVRKDTQIVQHLLEATRNDNLPVNYVLLLPNVSIDLVRNRIKNLYRKSKVGNEFYSLDLMISKKELVLHFLLCNVV